MSCSPSSSCVRRFAGGPRPVVRVRRRWRRPRRRRPGCAAGRPAATSATERSTGSGRRHRRPSTRCTTRVAAGQRGGRAERGQPGAARAPASAPRRSSPRSTARVRGARSRATSPRARVERRAAGRPAPGAPRSAASSRCSRSTQPASARRARSRSPAIRAVSSARSGTSRRPASVGVEQRRSATWSTSGVSGSCPIAETTGVRHAATARHSVSSENGSRSSTLPPPRASTITSTSGSRSSTRSASTICGDRQRALHGDVLDPEPHRGPAGGRVRHDVVLGGRGAPGDQPDAAAAGTAAGACGPGRTGPRRPAAVRSRSMRASSSPMPTARISSTRRLSVPRPRKNDGLPCTIDPVALGAPRPPPSRTSPTGAVSCSDTSAAGIAQHQERGAGAGAGGDLRELALHPHRAEPVDPLGDLARDRADRPGLLRWSERRGHSSVTVVIRLVSIVTNGGRLLVRGLPRRAGGQVVDGERAQLAAQLRDRHRRVAGQHVGPAASRCRSASGAGVGPEPAVGGARRSAGSVRSRTGPIGGRGGRGAATSPPVGVRRGCGRSSVTLLRPLRRGGGRRRTSPSSASPRPGAACPARGRP